MSSYKNEPIAIIGSSCRFAGPATSPSKLWELLKEPRDVLSKMDRFDTDNFYHPDGQHHGTSNVKHGYMLEQDVKTFDASFFNIQAGEAECIDPQQRFLLETVYEGIESAGLTLEGLQGSSTAIYCGVMCGDWDGIQFHDNESIPKYAATGTARSILANRISYFFNWTGPSIMLDTACSSSLVAVHQAVQSLRSGESSLAVAVGTNIILSPRNFIAESQLSMLSPDGRSRMWDANANGYARGEGVASVILKTLSQAIADGDTIECIIRESGVNQDGRTPGITMPSSDAQAALIRSTYAKAGLDLTKSSDRPHFFEAHGTGTKAGDPREAGAIYNAFFRDTGVEGTMHVGSVKTVIGHTEGTAGLAGLLKASMAIQNKTIPPNMLFETLNPDLKPFVGNLKIPLQALPWPELPAGVPRRASVNSFGFGGTNAHAILEAYEPETQATSGTTAIPFTFSAISEKALATQINTFISYLNDNKDVDLSSMAWTLSRRSTLTLRTAVSAFTNEDLVEKLEARLDARKANNTPLGVRAAKDSRSVLGIFTGQGAQWASMGRELILASEYVEKIVDDLEQSLAELPESSRPQWSLKSEMLAQGKASRIGEGLMSQPLCTAVQVILVNLLRTAGVKFEAVVGHSSGEIGAAYAAGFISAHDAIRIAYFRGFYAKLACGADGQKGSMLAAGTSLEDAEELCELPSLEGRIQVAASNSSSSLTLSGDEDAIAEALEILKDEGKFARQLKVDTAYHSHHMIPCSEPYLNSLEDCDIEILTPPTDAPRWFSSVFGGDEMTSDDLTAAYWAKNMLQPVLFSQALTAALDESGAPALALEVGPHPALKGPATSVIEEVLGSMVPYIGTLGRNSNDVGALSDTLGFIWAYLGPQNLSFKAYSELFGNHNQRLLKSLPNYTFDHDKAYWFESRVSRLFRAQRPQAMHQLLGIRMDDETEGSLRWHNFLKPSEIPWLRGHTIQGQILFPAAGFAALAVEGSKTITDPLDKEVSLIELHNFSIHNALAIADENAGAEIIFEINNIVKTDDTITARFNCDACANRDTGSLSSMASGELVIRLGETSLSALPNRPTPKYELRKVNVDNQYASFTDLGYNYNGDFRAITSLKRTTNLAMGRILVPEDVTEETPYTVHPAVLDVGLQITLCAIGAPFDSRLWTLHVPTIISKIKINPKVCPTQGGRGSEVVANSILAKQAEDAHGFTGDLSIYDPTGSHCFVQLEGVRVEALARPNKATDRHMFGEASWSVVEPDATLCFKGVTETDAQRRLGMLVERACFFYLKQLHEAITPEEREKCDEHRLAILNWAENLVSQTTQGSHPHLQQAWVNDTEELLKPVLLEAAEDFDDMHKVMFAGKSLIPFVRDEISILEEFKKLNLLDWFYKSSTDISVYNSCMGEVIKQIAHRFPYMNILEIGAGTGSATEAIVKQIGQSYSSYTYTDISAGFLSDAAELFKSHGSGFVYKVLDIEKDASEQGFIEGTYDCIVASNVLHATKSLDQTLSNARKLLRPGGYLVMLEITQVEWLRTGLFFAGVPGWWAGAEDGRPFTPLVSEAAWDTAFQRNGFSGIDTVTPTSTSYMAPYSVMVTQAMDTQMEIMRQPLATVPAKATIEKLLIVGARKVAEQVEALIEPHCGSVNIVDRLEEVNQDNFSAKCTVLSLTELDEPMFNPFTEAKYKAMQHVLDEARNILWVVQGSNTQNPYSRMMAAVARCLAGERRDALCMQTIDSNEGKVPEPKLFAESLLRLHINDQWKNAAYEPLWSLEREMHVNDEGTLEIERYFPSSELDDRYNSDKREIKKPMSLDSKILSLTQAGNVHQLREVLEMEFQKEAVQDLVAVRVKKSLLTAVKVRSVGSLYIVVGEIVRTGRKVLAFSESLQSTVHIPATWTVEYQVHDDTKLVLAAAVNCLADSILGKSKPNSGTCLIHEASPLLEKTLAKVAASRNIPVAFTSGIHPSTAQALIASHIPKDISIFANLSGATGQHAIGARIDQEIPTKCKRRDLSVLFSNDAYVNDEELVSFQLHKYYQRAVSDLPTVGDATTVALGQLPDTQIVNDLRIVDWATESTVPVSTSLINKQLRFRSDKTYWMVGATGEIGLSTCQWMVDRGACYFALTSRNPKVEQAWLDTMEELGVTVSILSMDATSRESIRKTHDTICKTMPPIAGVTNAAMVLDDSLLSNMSYESFAKTLKPKVDGTLYLDEIFSENTLDFFIVYSSLAYIAGNLGQAPYAAANGFMAALAANRRERGLAGSVMSFGAICGVGYVERRSVDINLTAKMSNLGYDPVSEWDYHQFFAEAVLASPPDSGRGFEISSGCKVFDAAKERNLPFWLDQPKFAYYKQIKANAFAEQGDKRQVSVRAQLKEQNTEEGVQQVLLDRFTSGLCVMLHISEEETKLAPEMSLAELGIDSLVAVEIRSWFQSELDLDMPVLKILSGASIETMVEDAFNRLSHELTPGVKREVKIEEKPEDKTEEKSDGYQSEELMASAQSSDDSSTSSDEEK